MNMIDMTKEQIEQVFGGEIAELATQQCIILKNCINEWNWHDWRCQYIYVPCTIAI